MLLVMGMLWNSVLMFSQAVWPLEGKVCIVLL